MIKILDRVIRFGCAVECLHGSDTFGAMQRSGRSLMNDLLLDQSVELTALRIGAVMV